MSHRQKKAGAQARYRPLTMKAPAGHAVPAAQSQATEALCGGKERAGEAASKAAGEEPGLLQRMIRSRMASGWSAN